MCYKLKSFLKETLSGLDTDFYNEINNLKHKFHNFPGNIQVQKTFSLKIKK